jgi:hypothetical protein
MTARWVALWAAMLVVFVAVMFVFGETDAISPLLLGGSALGTLALALVAARAERRHAAAVPGDAADASPGSAGVAVGVALLVGGSEVGPWMLALGAGMVALGIAGLVRERRPR